MSGKRHAEIAGAGIAGLSFAAMLAQRGWTVRVHERAPEIREVGAGIYIKNNATQVLEPMGIFERVAPHGMKLERSQVLDREGRIMQDRVLAGAARVHAFLRQTLIESLRAAAERASVEILTDSGAEAADPSGELVLENGRSLRADLVVAADGVRSKLRGSLNIGGGYRWLPTIVNRYLVTSREITPDLITREHWSGRCRVGVTPCGSNMTYVYQVCPEWDKVATALPNDVTYWSSAFPRLRRTFEILAHTEANRQNFSIVRCPRWQKGRVAIIGDAAHGLPPTLGQGVGLTLMNVHALAIRLEGNSDVQDVLPHWEAAVRSISDKTQRWAMRYDFFTRQWPSALWFARPAIIGAFRSIPALNRAMRIADQGLPSSALRSKALQ